MVNEGFHGIHIPMDWVLTPTTNFIAVGCMSLTLLICGYEMYLHVKNYQFPEIQRHILRILVFAPIYAVDSYIALMLPNIALYVNTLRDVYESFVLYQFIALLICYGGGEGALVRSLNSKQYKGKHLFPFGCVYFKLDRHFLIQCKRGVLQYCFFKIFTALIACILHPIGLYEEGDMSFATNAYPWFFFINNFSITVSLYYLVLFAVELDKDFAKYKPVLKFTAIKIVIFFAFWQGAMLVVLDEMAILDEPQNVKLQKKIGVSVQDFLICVELLPISLLIVKAYGWSALKQEVDDIKVFEDQQEKDGGGDDINRAGIAMEASCERQHSPKKDSPRHGGRVAAAAAHITEAVDLRDCIGDAKETFKTQKEGGLLEEAEGYDQTEEKLGKHPPLPSIGGSPIKSDNYGNDESITRELDDKLRDEDDEHDLVDVAVKGKNKKERKEIVDLSVSFGS